MRVLLVRHARAGARGEWEGDDGLRPLDGKGRKQAKRLAKTLEQLGATGLVSSPALRCVQTLEPAARRLDLPIAQRDELAEGGGPAELLALLGEVGGDVPALSTHGDVIAEVVGWGAPCKKGSIWILEVESGAIRAESYLPPA